MTKSAVKAHDKHEDDKTICSIKNAFQEDQNYTSKLAILSNDSSAKVIADNEQEDPTQVLIQCLFLVSELLVKQVNGPLKTVVDSVLALANKDEASCDEANKAVSNKLNKKPSEPTLH
ncbi:MAG: hypothetical protein ACJAS1_004521 [Oleiphilaceae bacterium]|jgi:hypothetical protein